MPSRAVGARTLATNSKVFTAIVDSLLADGLSVRFRAGGRSMLPTVRDGDCVTVAPVDPRAVAVGDVLFCRTWRGPVAHRVASIGARQRDARPRLFTLRGDASLGNDRPVAASDVIGRVISVDRGGRARDLALPRGSVGRWLLTAWLRARPMLTAAARACLQPPSRIA